MKWPRGELFVSIRRRRTEAGGVHQEWIALTPARAWTGLGSTREGAIRDLKPNALREELGLGL